MNAVTAIAALVVLVVLVMIYTTLVRKFVFPSIVVTFKNVLDGLRNKDYNKASIEFLFLALHIAAILLTAALAIAALLAL